MSLTQLEKERISDSRMKLQSVATSLDHIDPKKVPGFEDIQECLNEAERNLTGALRGLILRSAYKTVRTGVAHRPRATLLGLGFQATLGVSCPITVQLNQAHARLGRYEPPFAWKGGGTVGGPGAGIEPSYGFRLNRRNLSQPLKSAEFRRRFCAAG